MSHISRRDAIRTVAGSLAVVIGSATAAEHGKATAPPNGGELDLAPAPPDIVEKALNAHCAKNRVARDKIESFALDLIPETRTFRYILPPVPPPAGGSEYMQLSARYAFLFVNAKSGAVIEVKTTKFDHTIHESTGELFAAMKAAGVKVKTNDDATKVMRVFFYLDIATRSAEFHREKANVVKSRGRYRDRPDTFGGGVHCWSGGDDIGLQVDADGFVTHLLGGHVK